ncbi:HIT family protein [Phenylobacterium sp.]|uniref:HIT family protein n=1 Tax=Phenylobacterium sp. TaxID=1871053 RepID=UPI0027320F25|nr:HIT family protein [Phenylobacterium sp.]MDP1618440.1 HIT family protein [Phenylobacterium sp.]MDP1988067.1 HIT family protein [Phenylobacterium sp.]
MSNATAVNFGFPHSLVGETDHWLVLVRPKQPTFGSLVLVCKEPAQAFSDLSREAFEDLQVAVGGIERLLRSAVNYTKINYLMLMMVDPDVHFHVIPRYEGAREHGGETFTDAGWPGQPDLGAAVALSPEALRALAEKWRREWRAA